LRLPFKLQLAENQFEKNSPLARVRGGETTLRLRDMIIATEEPWKTTSRDAERSYRHSFHYKSCCGSEDLNHAIE
jgi:hypothetical protein